MDFFRLISALEQETEISSVSAVPHLGGAGPGVVAWLLLRSQRRSLSIRASNFPKIRLSSLIGRLSSARDVAASRRSSHLIPYLGIKLASEVAKIDKWKQQLAERGASKRFEAE